MMTQVEHVTLIAKTKFKTSMLRSSLCGYSDAYTLESEITIVTGAGNDDAVR